MAPSPSSTLSTDNAPSRPALPENHKSRPQASSCKGLAEIEDKEMFVYETETQQSKRIKRRALQSSYKEINAKEPTFLPVSIPPGRKHVDVVLPADQGHSLGPTQIASVPIPWSMFLKNSVSRHPGILYVTGRC